MTTKTTAKKTNTARVWAYTRVSTLEQSEDRQRLEIHAYANRQRWHIDRFLCCKVSSRRSEEERAIDVLKAAAERGDVAVVVFAELSRLGRSVGEIARLIDHFVAKGVALHFIKERLVLQPGPRDLTTKVLTTIFSLLAEVERDLISERTKSALAARKAAGVKLGRPAGRSKLDQHADTIRGWLTLGLSRRRIAAHLRCTPNLVCRWVNSRPAGWMTAQPA